MLLQKILLPTDLSSEGERAFTDIDELARANQASIVLLHVIENAGAHPVGEKRSAPTLLAGTRQEIERVRALLGPRCKAFKAQATLEVVVAPSVSHAVCDYAAQNGISLIALSSHGRTGFRRLVMGSVAEAVLRNARVPVLVFPRQE
ncbi:MAG: universal stress protein [Planctomycetota bacterium]